MHNDLESHLHCIELDAIIEEIEYSFENSMILTDCRVE